MPFPSVMLLAGVGTIIGPQISAKLSGNAADCSWAEITAFPVTRFQHWWRRSKVTDSLLIAGYDAASGIELIRSPKRSFWIRRAGTQFGGSELLSELIEEHGWAAARNPAETVQAGDTVFDCGAHVGVFTSLAVERGAAKVISVEPDPVNLECLRRNFSREIADGRVVLCPMGVWSAETTLVLHESEKNSGMNSAVLDRGGRAVEIPVTTIDALVKKLNLARVDLIKMDIEGAERNALAGASETLRAFHPRLMLDSYHRTDDMAAFRTLLLPGFRYSAAGCRWCDENPRFLVPEVTFWRAR